MPIKPYLKELAMKFGWYIYYHPRPQKNLKSWNQASSKDWDLYQPLYSPWRGKDFTSHFERSLTRSLISKDRAYVLYTLASQATSLDGNFMECGVYRGGTAAMFAQIIAESNVAKRLYLFDTFAGMPETNTELDYHVAGEFSDTSAESVATFVAEPEIAVIRKGFIPDTFAGLENATFSFAHLDLDIYKSTMDAMNYLWPRLERGGLIVFDDYGFASCLGVREAVDEFFSKKAARPLCLPTGQAVVFKSL
jgi:O-methyltransferase